MKYLLIDWINGLVQNSKKVTEYNKRFLKKAGEYNDLKFINSNTIKESSSKQLP